MLTRIVFPLIATLVVAGSCSGYPAGVHISKVENLPLIQREVPFNIVLPKYLPDGFRFADAVLEPDPVGRGANKFVTATYLDEDGVRDIFIRQGIPLPAESFPLNRKWEYKYLKNTRVQVEYGFGREIYMPDRSRRILEGVVVRWNRNGVSFYISTGGVLWDEMQKVVESMIE